MNLQPEALTMMSASRTLPLLQTTPLSLRAIGVSNTNVKPFSLDNLKKASLHCPAENSQLLTH